MSRERAPLFSLPCLPLEGRADLVVADHLELMLYAQHKGGPGAVQAWAPCIAQHWWGRVLLMGNVPLHATYHGCALVECMMLPHPHCALQRQLKPLAAGRMRHGI